MTNLLMTLDTLKQIRRELHNNVEQSVIDRFDSAVKELESYDSQGSDEIDAINILKLLDAALKVIPTIAAITDWLKNMFN